MERVQGSAQHGVCLHGSRCSEFLKRLGGVLPTRENLLQPCRKEFLLRLFYSERAGCPLAHITTLSLQGWTQGAAKSPTLGDLGGLSGMFKCHANLIWVR